MDADPNEAVDIFPRPKSGRAEGSATSDHSRASASPVAKQKQRQQHGSQGHPNWDMSVFPAVHVRGQIKAGALGQGRNQSEFAPGREGNFPPFVEGEFASGNPLFAETTHRCLGSMYTHRVCHYYNLYLWNDTIYYVTTDAGTLARGVPPVAMSWVAQPDSFAALQFGGDEAMWLEVIHPDDLPFDWQEQQKLVAEEVLAWKLTFQDNYGHLLGEHGPTLHAVLCSYMGRCQYSKADLEDLHILLVHEDDGEMDIIPAAGLEMIRCFSKHSMRLTNDPIFDNKVLVINHMMAGIGPECRGFPWCRASYGRNPLPAHLVVSWKEYLSQCIGLPSDLVAPVSHPNVVIVNRPYQVGRGFLNIQEAVQLLKANISSNAAISVHELDETSLVEQAKIYQNASVLVQMHGAALGNIIFLPRGACVIDIVPQNNEDKHPWVFFMAHDLQPLQYNPIALPPQKTVLMLHKIKHSMAWRLLPPHWRARILEDGVCPATNRDVNYQFDAYAACNFQWFLKNGNVLLDVAQLVEAVELAFKHIAMFEPRSKDLNYQFRSSRFAIGDA
ncbi:hypothetical protein WJX72_003660 [[Myrmecia] bisecta]|uniref:Glycosyltransferase 61 catalytic domain-containing protein n=1 Tax=[Myrmecia] bisecta TaxID=41462 RepID=A0AAW1Q055_9CHLO